ncbi:sulfotransferase family protein [Nonomuraea sp. NPDC050404]|uniref:sulfotransferase family protein n=1 Tax=Nonomuraea sp. NPDC050404 TaxID=3155783 RepID=UPI0033FE5830
MREGLRVIGVGLHRTGSMSVKAALERLGFGPCYHGLEALRRCADGEHWLAAHEAGGAFDWQVIFKGYRSALDWPTAHFWRQLAAAYPDAKILLTDRDPEQWWDSHTRMFRHGSAFIQQLTDEQRHWADTSGFTRMQNVLGMVASAAFDGRVFDKEHCLRAFHRHNEQVRRAIPAERLLVYRVQQGWEPLCRFLGTGVPTEAFPRVNAGPDLVHNIRTAMRSAREQTQEAVWR